MGTSADPLACSTPGVLITEQVERIEALEDEVEPLRAALAAVSGRRREPHPRPPMAGRFGERPRWRGRTWGL
jgi:hypothetical protein